MSKGRGRVRGRRVVGVRESARERRKILIDSANRPKTTVSVEKGFGKVLSANERAERLTYTR